MAIGEAMRCLVQRDIEGALRVVADDKKLDELEIETERRAVQLIALRAPMAGDLRDVVAALKISGVVERIGDYAKNIARRVPLIEGASEDRADVAAARNGAHRHRHGARRARRLRPARRRSRGAGVRARQCGRRFLRFGLPHLAHAHDGKPAQHRPVGASAVRRQEPRAGRRPRDQHRRDGLLSPPPASIWPRSPRIGRAPDRGPRAAQEGAAGRGRPAYRGAGPAALHQGRLRRHQHARRRRGAGAGPGNRSPTSSSSTG